MEPRMSMSDLMRMEFKQAFEEFDKVTVYVYVIQFTRSTTMVEGGRKVPNIVLLQNGRSPSENSLLSQRWASVAQMLSPTQGENDLFIFSLTPKVGHQ